MKKKIKIFISYSSEDYELAEKLFEDLGKDKLFEPWLDKKNLNPGDAWKDRIKEAIEAADCVIPILSKAAITNNRFFQEELEFVKEMSLNKIKNYIMPVQIEKFDINKSSIPELHFFELIPYDKQYPLLIKKIKLLHDFTGIVPISPRNVYFIEYMASIPLASLAPMFMGDEIQPPKFNIAFAPQTFPEEGGFIELFNTDVKDQLLTMRQYARQKNYRYTAFFVDINGQIINNELPIQKLKLKPIQLQLPKNIAMIFIALGYTDDLEYTQKVFGKEKILRENILWAVFGNETSRPDYLETFRSIIFDADKEANMEKRYAFLEDTDTRKKIKQAFDALIQAKDWVNIGMMLKVFAEETKNLPISSFGQYQSHEVCDELDKNKNEIEESYIKFTFLRAQKLKEYAEKGDHTTQYTDRHRFIESAIRLIWNECDSDNNWIHNETIPSNQAYQFIAHCYLYRSFLALKKGVTVPEKKLEALSKALEWVEKSNKQMVDLTMMIILEQSTWDDGFSINQLEISLKAYISQYDNDDLDLSKKLNLAVVDKLLSLLMNKDVLPIEDQELLKRLAEYDKQILYIKDDSKIEKGTIQLPLSLYQARSAYRQNSSEISSYLEKAVSDLDNYLQTNILWDKTISIIKKVSEKAVFQGKWETAAINAWKICAEAENRINLSIQLRWYWSQKISLYNLAFQAALNRIQENNLRPVCISDTEKSRPTIKIQNAEKFLKDEDFEFYKLYLETDMSFFTDAYITKYQKLRKNTSTIYHFYKDCSEHHFVDNIPEGWSAVHFYILNTSDAYALIISSKTRQAIPVKLSITELWKVFKRWHLNYRSLSTSTDIDDLCLESGKMLKPVLDKIDTDKIIFIPHGFLHLVPLHASIFYGQDTSDTGKKMPYLFLQKTCVYLPSWSIFSSTKKNTFHSKNDYFFSHWKPHEQLEDLLNLTWTNIKQINNTPKEVTPKEVIEKLEKDQIPPHLLTFFCHGKGDFLNPYNSKLLFDKGGLTHQTVKSGKFSLNGTKVVLTACETDFVAGYFGLVDEHLSLANAFLTKNAAEVLGSLFKYPPIYAIELIKHIKENPNNHLYESLHEIQKQWVEKQRPLHDIAAFRVMGLPKTGGKNND